MTNILDGVTVDFSYMSAREALNKLIETVGVAAVIEGIKDKCLKEEMTDYTEFIFDFSTYDLIIQNGQLIVFRK